MEIKITNMVAVVQGLSMGVNTNTGEGGAVFYLPM